MKKSQDSSLQVALVSNVVAAASEANAIDRTKDVSFAITSMLASKDYSPSIQANAIAVAGHSYGANTALLVGGAMVERDGKSLSLRDERVKALILISAQSVRPRQRAGQSAHRVQRRDAQHLH